MSAIANHPTFNLLRIAVLTLVVFLSIALPIGIIWSSVRFAMSGKPPGRPSPERKHYHGSLKNRDFWYFAGRYVGKTGERFHEWRIDRLNVDTGVETVFEISRDFKRPLWVGEELYGLGDSLYRAVDGAFAKIAEFPAASDNRSFWTDIFPYDGRLTMALERKNGKFVFCHLVDDQWIEGREFLLPVQGSVWIEDPQHGFKLTSPGSSPQPTSGGDQRQLYVIQHERDVHFFLCDNSWSIAAYRNGFEFVDHDNAIASALSPENTETRNSKRGFGEWEQIQPTKGDVRWGGMAVDRDGVLIFERGRPGRVVRRNKSGDWVDLEGIAELGKTLVPNRTIVVDQSDGVGYILDTDWLWNSVVAYRINGNTVEAPHVLNRGCFAEYLARWECLFAGAILAWVVHAGLLVSGAVWSIRGRYSSDYSFGARHVKLASIPRRGLAFCADLLSLLLIVVLLTRAQYEIFGIELPQSTENISQALLNFESAAHLGIQNGFDAFVSALAFNPSQSPYQPFEFPLHGYLDLITVELIEILLVLGIGAYFEGRFGITPGKYLFGIRTLRASLRPCGFTRALVRNVLAWVDMPFFVTPTPAAISMMLSANLQRLGDRVADTVVVNASSFDLCPRGVAD